MADPEKKAIHVDEEAGHDSEAADGSPAKPFKTLGYAYLLHADHAQYLSKKRDGDEPEPTYKPAAKAAMKKAVNYADQQRKKAAKEKELAIRQQKEDEERAKVFEEAKKITKIGRAHV